MKSKTEFKQNMLKTLTKIEKELVKAAYDSFFVGLSEMEVDLWGIVHKLNEVKEENFKGLEVKRSKRSHSKKTALKIA